MKRERRGPISPVTIGRRTWMEWFGGAAVVSLSRYLAGCGADDGGQTQGALPEGDSGAPWEAGADALPDAGSAEAEAAADALPGCETQFAFSPGQGTASVFEGWGERTVDDQNLDALLSTWKLRVDGLVETPREFTFQELMCLPRQDQTTDFHCVEGWSIYDVPWNGVHLSQVFALVKPLSTATHVAFRSAGGEYDESLPIDVALEPRTMLGYGVAASSLPLKHGFPARIVIPRLLGYKNAKYVQRIELVDKAVIGYWSQLGYPYEGEVPPARLRPGRY